MNLLGKVTTIAHGMMTLSFMGKIITDWAYPGGAFLRSLEGKFIHSVRPGDDITVHAVVTEFHPRHKKEESFSILEISRLGCLNPILRSHIVLHILILAAYPLIPPGIPVNNAGSRLSVFITPLNHVI